MMLMGPVSTEPKIELDMDLRPEGKNGPSCARTPRVRSTTVHGQACGSARRCCAPDSQPATKELAEDFLANVANPFRYPAERLTDDQLQEIRRLKARMEAERLPRGVRRDPGISNSAGEACRMSNGPCSCCNCSMRMTLRRCR